jgi:preprotein translocase subunit SecB
MADENTAAQDGGAQQQTQGQMRMQKIYVKDISLETPNSPQVFMQQQQFQPQVDFNINANSQRIQEDLFEVTLNVTVTVKNGEQTAFLVEVQQAGLFTLTGFQSQQLHYMLGAYCPSVLFPYARESVSDLVTRSGFPPLLLEPVNFDAAYGQHLEQQQAQPAPTTAS